MRGSPDPASVRPQDSHPLGATNALRLLAALVVPVFLGTVLLQLARADDWPQWRGPNRDAVWHETGIMEKFPAGGPNVLWRVPVGTGFCSPVVAEGRVYLVDAELSRPKARERVQCWEARTGRPLWNHAYDVAYPERAYAPDNRGGPNSTPVVHDGRLYTWGRRGDIFCFDARKGDVLWHKNVLEEYRINEFTGTPSPLIEKDLLIIALGGKPNAGVVAFHRLSGKEVWKSLDEEPTYSSPIVIEAGGKRQLIVWTYASVTSLDPATGTRYWRERFILGGTTGVSTPVFLNNRLLVAGLMLRLDPDKPAARVLWPKSSALARRILSNTSTALLHGDHVYSAKSSGELVCLDAETGEQVWAVETVTGLNRGAAMHITRNGNSFLIHTDRGELIRAHLSPKGYKELSRIPLIKPTFPFEGKKFVWSSPAYAHRCIFTRNQEELICASLAAH